MTFHQSLYLYKYLFSIRFLYFNNIIESIKFIEKRSLKEKIEGYCKKRKRKFKVLVEPTPGFELGPSA